MHAHRQDIHNLRLHNNYYQPYHYDYQGPLHPYTAHQPQQHRRFQSLLHPAQPIGFSHPPSTHTPALLQFDLPRPSSPLSSPAITAPPTPYTQTHSSMLPPLPPQQDPAVTAEAEADEYPPSHHPPADNTNTNADADNALTTTDSSTAADAPPSRAAPRPFYDFPEQVITTAEIIRTRDVDSNRMLNQYSLGHRLGRGQHGDVYKGFDTTRDDMVVAIKACKRKSKDRMEELRAKNAMERAAAAAASSAAASGSGEGRGLPRMQGGAGYLVDRVQTAEKKVLREIAIMKKCKHGQIVQLLEVIDDRQTSKIFMVMEYMGGGEVKWRDLQSQPVLRVDQARRICRDVVLGLEYLHYQGIIHRDIKPANLLWTGDRRGVKITDFGVSHFSYAQRLKNVRASEAYKCAAERKRKRLEREREAKERSERAQHWRFQGKGKGRAGPGVGAGSANVSAGSSGRATPTLGGKEKLQGPGDEADDEDDADILAALEEVPDPLLLDDGGLSRQAGTPSFLAPELVWEFRRERQEALVRRFGGGRKKKESVGAGMSGSGGNAIASGGLFGGGNPFGAGWFGGESVTAAAVGGTEGTESSLLATHPTHTHSPVRPGMSRSRSASNPNPEVEVEGSITALPPGGGAEVASVVNVIPPSERSLPVDINNNEEPGSATSSGPGPSPSPSPSPSPPSRNSPTSTSPSNVNETDTATTTINALPSQSIATTSAAANLDIDADSDAEDEAILDAPRPPVTKAIDVWALGVTLYCLLFARCPWTGVNEFVLFQAIHAREFEIPETMGADRVSTGGGRRYGRPLEKEEEKDEGCVVVWLLERLLEKDVEKRITLDEVKRLPWITRDIPNPDAWLEETSPQRHDPINVTAADESDAMSLLRFTWRRREPAVTGFGKIRQAGGRALRALLPGRRSGTGTGTPMTSGRPLEDVEESDVGVHTEGHGQGWIAGLKSKSRVDLLSGSRKGKGKERERDTEVGPSGLNRTPSRSRRLARATADAVERVARSGSLRSNSKTDSMRKRGKLPELRLNTASRSRESSLSRPGSRAQTPDVRQSSSATYFVPSSSPSYSYSYGYAGTDEFGGGPPTPRGRAESTSALTSPTDLSSDDILDEDDERVVEEREMARREAEEARRVVARAEEERVSRRSSIQKFLSFGRQRSSRSSLSEQNKKTAERDKDRKGKQKRGVKTRGRAGTTGTASGSGSDAAAVAVMGGSRTLGVRGLGRKSEDNMRLGRFPGLGHGPGPSSAAATSGMGYRTGSGPALSADASRLAAGASFDDGAMISGDLTSAMRASSWEGSGGAYYPYPSRDFDVISDIDNQSIAFVDEDTRMIGAGGIWSHPGTVPGSPASQHHSRSGGSISAQAMSGDALFLPEPIAPAYGHTVTSTFPHPQRELFAAQQPGIPVLADPALQDPTVGYSIVRSTNIFSSPLARTAVNNNNGDSINNEGNDVSVEDLRYGEAGHDSSGESGEHVSGRHRHAHGRRGGEVEEESESEAEDAIMVRRRRPSQTLARSRSRARQENA